MLRWMLAAAAAVAWTEPGDVSRNDVNAQAAGECSLSREQCVELMNQDDDAELPFRPVTFQPRMDRGSRLLGVHLACTFCEAA